MNVISKPQVLRVRVRTYRVTLQCDNPGLGYRCWGEMQATEEALMSRPPMYLHRCNACGYEAAVPGGKKYPTVDYEEKG